MQYNAFTIGPMSPDLKPATFRLEADLLAGLQQIKLRDGIPVTEQVRRAIQAWLTERGIDPKKSDRQRVTARKRS